MTTDSREVLVGIDKGTSSIKAIAVHAGSGELLAYSSGKTPAIYPKPNYHEEDFEGSWRACAGAIQDVMSRLDPGAIVIGVGVTGHMGGVWAVDADGQPVGRAICWPDARAASILRDVQARSGKRLFEISGNAMIPGNPFPLLSWLKQNDPSLYSRIRHVLIAKDWINYRLTGVLCTDESDLSFWPCDITQRSLSPELFALFGIEEAEAFVPEVRASDSLIGSVSQEAAELTGLPVGTPVVAGCGDAVANMLGVGAERDGDATTTLGTSLMNGVLASRAVLEPQGVGFSFLMPQGRWQRQITNSGGGTMCLDWVVKTFCSGQMRQVDKGVLSLGAVVDQAVSETPPGNGGLVFHPYLNTAGATAPFVDVNARGSFVHLKPETNSAALVRAVLEGTSLAVRDCYEAMPVPVHEIRLTGGGARSPAWSQLIADVLQKEIVVPDVPESGALGAAMLAGTAVNRYSGLDEAAHVLVREGRTHEPEPRLAAVYDELFAEYRHLVSPLCDIWAQTADHLWRSDEGAV